MIIRSVKKQQSLCSRSRSANKFNEINESSNQSGHHDRYYHHFNIDHNKHNHKYSSSNNLNNPNNPNFNHSNPNLDPNQPPKSLTTYSAYDKVRLNSENRSHSRKKVFTDQTTYTYKPEINNLPFQLYPNTQSLLQISKEQIFQRLQQNIKTKQQRLAILRLNQQQDKFKQQCKFKPQINLLSKKIAQDKIKNQPKLENPFIRLYTQAVSKQHFAQKACLALQQEKLSQQHTFKPSINQNSKKIINTQSHSNEPLYKRVENIMQKKRLQEKQIQQNQIKVIQASTQIKINKKSEQLLEKNEKFQKQKGNVVKRLLDDYFKQKQQKMSKIVKQQKQKQNKQCTFRPAINSNFLLMNDSNFNKEMDFIERQQQFEEFTKQNIRAKANELIPCFKPEINKLSQLICKQRVYQSLNDKVNRLNCCNSLQKQIKIEQIQKQVYKQCRFYPQINLISKERQGPVKSHACKCHPVSESYDFKPKINFKSRQIVSNVNIVSQKNKKSKEQKINKIKMDRQYKQLMECTFEPKTKELNRKMLKQNVSEIVSGAKQFIIKKKQAIKKKNQDQQYKQKIFNLEKRYDQRTAFKSANIKKVR